MDRDAHFVLGRVVATPGAMGALTQSNERAEHYIMRHGTGDWGQLDDEDKKANDAACSPSEPQRILSAYTLHTGVQIWIIAEWGRSVTTILLPEEY